jgi:Photosynthetic reaction centre cytochrome C subunit
MHPCVLILYVASLCLFAQDQGKQGGPPPAPKNLKVLTPDVNIGQVMRRFTAGLGVQCGYCHAPGDFASDENPKKEMARRMLVMIKQINRNFPDAGNDFANSRYLSFPEGKQYVTCYTCHQGETKPRFETPEPVKRAPEPYAPGAQGVGIPEAPPPPPGVSGAQK